MLNPGLHWEFLSNYSVQDRISYLHTGWDEVTDNTDYMVHLTPVYHANHCISKHFMVLNKPIAAPALQCVSEFPYVLQISRVFFGNVHRLLAMYSNVQNLRAQAKSTEGN